VIVGYGKIQMPFQIVPFLAEGESSTTETADQMTKSQVHPLHKRGVDLLHSQGTMLPPIVKTEKLKT